MHTQHPCNFKLTASLICGNMLRLEEEIRALEAGGIDCIHFDVMDAMFVPRYGLHPEMLSAVRSITTLPIHVHAMVENVEPYIQSFVDAGANAIMPHIESHPHIHRTLRLIREAGADPGVALNIATPLSSLDYLIEDLKVIMLMAINPGIVGHKLIPGALTKISALKERLQGRPMEIEIDGGVTPESAPEMIRRGATRLVCGTGMIFRPHEAPLDVKSKQVRADLERVLREAVAAVAV